MTKSKRIASSLLAALALPLVMLVSAADAVPLNIILFVGDGMGFEAVEAARMYANNNTAPLFFETLPYAGSMTHNNRSNATTDSAASGTAMATGVKVSNGTISVDQPGDASELPTVLEILSAAGKRTGLVTIHTAMTDATPAAFGAHATDRGKAAEIANDYLTQSRPNVLFGGTQADLLAGAPGAGYNTVTTLASFNSLNPNASTHYAGLFTAAQQPTLASMTSTALNILDNDPDGFFLMVENEDPDNGGHANDLNTVVQGVLQLNDAVLAAQTWATGAGMLANTLIIVTADHETGGLNVTTSNGIGVLPNHTWSTGNHTQTPVPVFASGPAADASRVTGTIDNTDIFSILTSTMPAEAAAVSGTTVSFQQGVNGYTGTKDTYLDEANPSTNRGAATTVLMDGDTAGGLDAQGLLRFDNIFGTGPGLIPLNQEILHADLRVRITNAGTSVELFRMLRSWAESNTWNSLTGGLSANGIEAALAFDASTGDSDLGIFTIDVTNTLRAWQANPASNFGWAFLPTDEDGAAFFSAQGTTPPVLLVTFADPVPAPEPAALLMFVTLGLIFSRFRSSHQRGDGAGRRPEL